MIRPGYYRKLYVKVWGDRKFRALSAPQPNAQTLLLYLLTGPHTEGHPPGLFALGIGALEDALGWPREPLLERFRELFTQRLAKADWNARVVWLPNAIKYDRPANPNIVVAWRRWFTDIPECDLKVEAFQAFKLFLEPFGKPFSKPFDQPLPERLGEPLGERPKPLSSSTESIVNGSGNRSDSPTKDGPKTSTRAAVDAAFIAGLRTAYVGLDLDTELRKMDAWILANPGRKKTRKFVVGWLNRCDLPSVASSNGTPSPQALTSEGFPVEPVLQNHWFNRDCSWHVACVKTEHWAEFVAQWGLTAWPGRDQCPLHRMEENPR